MKRLDVKTSKLHIVLGVLLGLFFVPLGLLLITNGLLQGFRVETVGIGFLCLVMFVVVFLLVRRAHTRTVKYFSDEGLVRNDGKSFAWADLHRVVNQIRIRPTPGANKKYIWRTEIQFNGGEAAWLIPLKVSNYPEVRNFVISLPCEHTEVRE
jgi:hypothetical protein